MEPLVSLSPHLEEGKDGEKVLHLGHTLAEDTATRTLELKNDTALAVRFEIEMESLLPKSMRKKRSDTFSELNGKFNMDFSSPFIASGGVIIFRYFIQ
jgi:hypothetical protein